MVHRRALRILGWTAIGLVVVIAGWIGAAFVVYPNDYVVRVLAWRESDVDDYLHHFPHSPLTASTEPLLLPSAGEVEQERARTVLQATYDTDDLDDFLDGTRTQALIVIKDDRIVAEHYGDGWERDSLLTSFSVAKSFVSTLVGIAIEEGHIGGLDDAVTDLLPELAERDERFEQVTIRDLLTMSSGFAYEENRWWLFNGDDPLTTYHPDQRDLALTNTHVERPPAEVFSYNKYHPQLLGLILERTTGMSVTEYTQTRLWEPLGMEFDGSWSLDSTESGFEKLEAGLNARAVDYAKLGRLFLHDGDWNGTEVLPAEWVALASGTDPAGRAPAFEDGRHYGLMWWGWEHPGDDPDYVAWGDHGQFVFVSPAHDVVIVRNGGEAGIPEADWIDGFQRAAAEL